LPAASRYVSSIPVHRRFLTPSQISTLVSAAVISAVCFLLDYRLLRWRISGKEVDGDKIWKNLRRFSGWACAGCVMGAASCFAFMQFRHNDFESYSPTGTNFIVYDRFYLETQASSFRYFASFHFFFPLHIICIVSAWNILLRRVSDHASHSYYNIARDETTSRSSSRRKFDWRDCIGEYARYNMVRSIHVLAMLLCSLDILSRWVTVGGYVKRAGLYDQAAVSTSSSGAATNATAAILDKLDSGAREVSIPSGLAQALEAAVMALEVAAFVLFFPTCIIMFRRVERRLDRILQEMSLRSDHGNVLLPFEFSPPSVDGSPSQTEMPISDARQFLNSVKAAASRQRNKFIFCLFFVLVALLCLSAQSTFTFAIAVQPFIGDNLSCGYCGPCRSIEYVVLSWYRRVPELFLLFASMCSAPPLVFSLWLMTTPEDRALLLQPHKFLSSSRHSIEDESKAKLRSDTVRMGIVLQ
jgi:hypothetical protein